MFGGISGACFNPAVGIALTFTGNEGNYSKLWIYLLGPLTGGLLAGLVHIAHVSYIKGRNERMEQSHGS